MQLKGEQHIAAASERVWVALNDPEVLAVCIPGCKSLVRDGDLGFKAVVEIKIGPIGARFNGAVELKDLDPPHGYRIEGSGLGGMAGSARGGANVRLVAGQGGTLLTYDVDAEVGGRLAQLGGPIIDATAKQLAAKFFKRFEEEVTGTAAAGLAAASQPAASQAAATEIAGGRIPAESARPGFPFALVLSVIAALIAGFLLGRSMEDGYWIIAVIGLAIVCVGAGWQVGRRGVR